MCCSGPHGLYSRPKTNSSFTIDTLGIKKETNAAPRQRTGNYELQLSEGLGFSVTIYAKICKILHGPLASGRLAEVPLFSLSWFI